jgi:hypothetical protein
MPSGYITADNGFCQTDGDYSNLLQFLKGDGAFEKWFMEVFTKLDTSVQDNAQGSALVGRAIGGLGALMYLGYMGWQMAAGDREWEITPMLKPILIGFTLVYWTGFVNLLQAPFEAIAEPGIAIFSDIESEVNDLRVQRFKNNNNYWMRSLSSMPKKMPNRRSLTILQKMRMILGLISVRGLINCYSLSRNGRSGCSSRCRNWSPK